MAAPQPVQILSLKDAEAFNEGAGIAFTMVTGQGEGRLMVPSVDLGNILTFFATCAGAVGDQLAIAGKPSWPPANDLVPIPATGIGFQAAETPNKTWLVMNLSGFALAFEIPSSGLADMADELGQIARTLSAGGRKAQLDPSPCVGPHNLRLHQARAKLRS